jgi:hypothetical protein
VVKHTRIVLGALLVCAAAIQSVSAQDEWASRRRFRGDGVHVRIARDYYLPADQVATRPVVIVGGSATIDGTIESDLVVIGGPVRIGATAHIRGDITTVGGGVQLADGAEVSGEIQDVSLIWPDLRFVFPDWFRGGNRLWWAMFSLIGNILRLTLVMIAACAVALVAPRWIRRIARNAADAPALSGLLGVGTELMFLPVLLLSTLSLIITIVGIPLLLLVPFAVLAFLVVWIAGFAGVAAQIGGGFRARATGATWDAPALDTACGVALLGLLPVVANVLALGPSYFGPAAAACAAAGVVIEYLAWTVGLGAALVAPFRNGWRAEPPPLPARPNASVIA